MIFDRGYWFVLLFSAISAGAQVRQEAYRALLDTLLDHDVEEVSVKQLAAMDGVVLLDAREPDEFAVSHLQGAIPVGYDKFNLKTVSALDKNQRIVVYCSVGYRSEKIAERLKEAGFKHVSNLYGGIFEWVNEDMPVVDQTATPTDRVHAYSPTWGVWLTRGVKVYDSSSPKKK